MPARLCICQNCTHTGHQPIHRGRHQRCDPCQQAIEQARPKTAARGYGSKHQRLRARLIAQWVPGDPCSHCGKPMMTKDDLDLAHKADRSGYRGLAHAECNRGNR